MAPPASVADHTSTGQGGIVGNPTVDSTGLGDSLAHTQALCPLLGPHVTYKQRGPRVVPHFPLASELWTTVTPWLTEDLLGPITTTTAVTWDF